MATVETTAQHASRAPGSASRAPGSASRAPGGRARLPGSKLRVGLFVDARMQPRWAVDAFARAAIAGDAEIVVLADGCLAPRAEPLGWQLYAALDRRLLGSGADCQRPLDIAANVAHRRLIALPPAGASSEKLETWRRELAALDLDVAFALGDFDDTILDGLAAHGVWRFWFGEERAAPSAAAGFREVVDGDPLSSSGLKVRLAADDEERIAYQSWSRTYPYSPARNRDQVLAKTSQFAARAFALLRRSGRAWLERAEPVLAAPAGSGVPGGWHLALDLARLGWRIARRSAQRLLQVEQWFLAYRLQECGARSGDPATPGDLAQFTRLVPPADRLWADPFPIVLAGRHFIFFEELLFSRGKAHISMVEIDAAGRASDPVRVLERDYHLSYPFMLEQDGQLYMIPESSENRTLELWRCIEFPSRWRLERTLLQNVACADATLHHAADGGWWLFASVAAEGASLDDELHLFYADRLDGDWQPHPMNPLRSDVRGARPAGRLFERDGVLYRPSQIGAPLYGSAIAINRVLRLTRTEYLEREVRRIAPRDSSQDAQRETPQVLGMHTLNEAGRLLVMDCFARRLRALPGSRAAREALAALRAAAAALRRAAKGGALSGKANP